MISSTRTSLLSAPPWQRGLPPEPCGRSCRVRLLGPVKLPAPVAGDQRVNMVTYSAVLGCQTGDPQSDLPAPLRGGLDHGSRIGPLESSEQLPAPSGRRER